MSGNRARRAVLVAGAICIAALAASSASASTISSGSGQIQILGDDDADSIVLSGGPAGVTVVDTGTGGATAGADCAQVNAQTVTCTPMAGDPRLNFFSVSLGDGVDSFINQGFAAEFGQIGAPATTGAKTISAGPGAQLVLGGTDSDLIDGGDGNDRLFDGGGFSGVSETGGNDTLIGGPGEDGAQYTRNTLAPLNITLDLIANDGQAGETDNVQVENIVAGPGADIVVGDASPNDLSGLGGADTIRGMAGNDRLTGDFGSAVVLTRGLVAAPPINDTLEGGAGRDAINCGTGYDLSLGDPFDEVSPNCERTGALLAAESAALSGKNKAKIGIECPESEIEACAGRLSLLANDKKIGKGKFSVAAGTIKKAKAKLTKKGAKALAKAGGTLLATADVITTEPGGVAQSDGQILLYR